MNILLLSNKFPYPPRDGGSIATLNMATGLARRGCQVSLLAVNTSKHHADVASVPEAIRGEIDICAVTIDTGIRPFRLAMNLVFSRLPYNATRFRSSGVIRELERLLRETAFDVIQLEGPYLYYCIPAARRNSRALISLRAHNIEHEVWSRNAHHVNRTLRKKYLELLSRRIRKLEKRLLDRIDLLLPISTRDAGIFSAMKDGLPVHTVPFGLYLEDYPAKDPPAEFSIFFIGALDWFPNTEGLDWFIGRVWPALREELPGTRLHIAGRNAQKDTLNNAGDGIVFHGEVEDARVFMSQHSVMIVPLRSGSGIRVKILEGMAMGKAIVTTSIGCEGIGTLSGRDLIVADGPEEFVAAIKSLAMKPGTLGAMASNARQFIKEKFDNLVVCQDLIDFYKEHA